MATLGFRRHNNERVRILAELILFVMPVLAFAGAVAAVVVWPGRFTKAVLAVVVVLGLLDLVAWGAFVMDFNDADGFFDCVECNATQSAVGIGIFYAPILMSAAVLTAVSYAAVRRSRPRDTA